MYKKMVKSHSVEKDSKDTEGTDDRASKAVWTSWRSDETSY